MISTSSLVFDGHHAHGLGPGPGPGPGPHNMAFVDPYMRSKLQPAVPEFIRPLPKPAPLVARCNSQRPSPTQSPRKEYQNLPVSSSSGPVNLTSIKHDSDNISDSQINRTSGNMQIPHLAAAAYTSRMFPHPGFHYSSLQTYGSLYTSPYSLLNRPTYINSTPLSPLERQYSPPQSGNGSSHNPAAAFLPPGGYSNQNTPPQPHPPPPPPPPPIAKPGQSLLREKRPFKVPAEKDISAKQQQHHHRAVNSNKNATKRILIPSNVNNNNNNNYLFEPTFAKGALIQLGNGDLKAVEAVTTEDLLSSCERCRSVKVDPATVVRIEEAGNGHVVVTLSYGKHKNIIEVDSTLERPYYVYGQGWASCDPERTNKFYGLECSRLQVGDICVSLSLKLDQQQQQQPQPQQPPSSLQQQQQQRSNSVKSTAQISNRLNPSSSSNSSSSYQSKPVDSNQYSPNSRVDSSKSEDDRIKSDNDYQSDEDRNGKRRRWSAPDQLDAEDEYIDPGSPSPSQKRLKDDNNKTVN